MNNLAISRVYFRELSKNHSLFCCVCSPVQQDELYILILICADIQEWQIFTHLFLFLQQDVEKFSDIEKLYLYLKLPSGPSSNTEKR